MNVEQEVVLKENIQDLFNVDYSEVIVHNELHVIVNNISGSLSEIGTIAAKLVYRIQKQYQLPIVPEFGVSTMDEIKFPIRDAYREKGIQIHFRLYR